MTSPVSFKTTDSEVIVEARCSKRWLASCAAATLGTITYLGCTILAVSNYAHKPSETYLGAFAWKFVEAAVGTGMAAGAICGLMGMVGMCVNPREKQN